LPRWGINPQARYADIRREHRGRESLEEKEKPCAMSTRDKGNTQRRRRMIDRDTVEEEDLVFG
jgi:hypothetical protein